MKAILTSPKEISDKLEKLAKESSTVFASGTYLAAPAGETEK